MGLLLVVAAASSCRDPAVVCEPTTCDALGLDCSAVDDGCGGILSCGTCTPPLQCGGGGVANVCGTAPCIPDAEACTRAGKNCDDFPDGCGGFVYCGECPPGQMCGGAAPPNVCGPDSCAHTTCADSLADCGTIVDICGGEIDCGACIPPETCGGGGVPNVCGCRPTEAAELCWLHWADCGPLSVTDRCGVAREVDCGPCWDGSTCGALAPNRCGCVPTPCPAAACGLIADGCGAERFCGPCPAPGICGLAAANVCGCLPTTCAALGQGCGEAYDGCGELLDCGPCSGSVPRLRLRIMAANLSSGNYQSYDPGEGIRILQGLTPDVVAIQEMSYGDDSPWDIRAFVSLAFGDGFYHAREVGDVPNGIISRYPIVEAGEWPDSRVDNRDFAWARIDLPGPKDLWVVSLHLLTSNATTRAAEIDALLPRIAATVPGGDYLVVAGDLNTKSRGEAAIVSLAQVVVTAPPHPADQAGNGYTNANRDEPYDWVLVDADLAAFAVPVQIGAQPFAAGLVFDSRVFSPLSAVAPVLAGDSGAFNMQHMAVVRDFAVPTQ